LVLEAELVDVLEWAEKTLAGLLGFQGLDEKLLEAVDHTECYLCIGMAAASGKVLPQDLKEGRPIDISTAAVVLDYFYDMLQAGKPAAGCRPVQFLLG
jgi:hypothetical protein